MDTALAPCLWAEISEPAVEHNLMLIRSLIGEDVRICAPIKADAYGHSVELLLPVLSRCSDSLACVTAEEALHLRSLGYDGEILMMFSVGGYAAGAPDVLETLIRNRVTLTCTDIPTADLIAWSASRAQQAARVHVMIDTGMNRSGVKKPQAKKLIEHLRKLPSVNLCGIYTHYACSGDADKTTAFEQLEAFHRAVKSFGDRDGLTLHTANSAAVIDLPQAHLDMVRPGLCVYGYQPSDEMVRYVPLKPAARVMGRLMQVKEISAGERCGYGLTHEFDRPGRIGLVPIGYADGYFRCFSNRTVMRIGEKTVPVVGRISMDQTILDLTEVPEARVGDKVEIMSDRRADPHSVENLAKMAQTIPYEVVTRLGHRVRRVLVDAAKRVTLTPRAGSSSESRKAKHSMKSQRTGIRVQTSSKSEK